jgi:hypothetical protein
MASVSQDLILAKRSVLQASRLHPGIYSWKVRPGMQTKEREKVFHYCDLKEDTNHDECHYRVTTVRSSCRDQPYLRTRSGKNGRMAGCTV